MNDVEPPPEEEDSVIDVLKNFLPVAHGVGQQTRRPTSPVAQQHRAAPAEPTKEQQVGLSNTSGPSGSADQYWGAPPRGPVPADPIPDQDRPGVPDLPRTGDQQVDDALASLLAVQDLAPDDQVEAYVGAHRALQDRLADLEG